MVFQMKSKITSSRCFLASQINMSRLEVLSRFDRDTLRMIRLCEASIEDQQLARAEFGPEHEQSFNEVESLMRETIEVLVARRFGKDASRALKALRKGRW